MDEKNEVENNASEIQIQTIDTPQYEETIPHRDLDKYPSSIKYIMGDEVCERFETSIYHFFLLSLIFEKDFHFMG